VFSETRTRPFSFDSPLEPLTTPSQKSGARDPPTPPGLTPMCWRYIGVCCCICCCRNFGRKRLLLQQ